MKENKGLGFGRPRPAAVQFLKAAASAAVERVDQANIVADIAASEDEGVCCAHCSFILFPPSLPPSAALSQVNY